MSQPSMSSIVVYTHAVTLGKNVVNNRIIGYVKQITINYTINLCQLPAIVTCPGWNKSNKRNQYNIVHSWVRTDRQRVTSELGKWYASSKSYHVMRANQRKNVISTSTFVDQDKRKSEDENIHSSENRFYLLDSNILSNIVRRIAPSQKVLDCL